jgi:hypothetical protein
MEKVKKVIVEFYFETRGYQVFEVPLDYEIDEATPNEAYNNLFDLYGHKDGCIKCVPINPERFGNGLGGFSYFGDIVQLNPNDNLHIVDFEFNKQVLEEEAEYYGENLDEEEF